MDDVSPQSWSQEQHGSGPRHYAARLNGTVFEIYPCTDGQNHGSVRIGFAIESVDRIVAELKAQGSRIIAVPKSSPWGRRAVIEDPNGFRVELTELGTSIQAS